MDNNVVSKFNTVIVILLGIALLTGCAKKPDKDKIVAQINNYQVTIDDFNEEAKMSIPGASKDQILQDIIIKELLLEEAQKNDLDKNRRFMKEIENYWKQALIKRVIFIKGEEFLASSKASNAEIKERYDLMAKQSDGKIKPFNKMADVIRQEIRVRKAQIMLDQWIEQLKNKATITTNEAAFDNLKIIKISEQDGGTDE